MVRPVAERTRPRNSSPLAASRTALVATRTTRRGARGRLGEQVADRGDAAGHALPRRAGAARADAGADPRLDRPAEQRDQAGRRGRGRRRAA